MSEGWDMDLHRNNQYYACCPKCKSSISIRKNKVQVDPLVTAENQPETIERKVI
jgi:hypothetical protein